MTLFIARSILLTSIETSLGLALSRHGHWADGTLTPVILPLVVISQGPPAVSNFRFHKIALGVPQDCQSILGQENPRSWVFPVEGSNLTTVSLFSKCRAMSLIQLLSERKLVLLYWWILAFCLPCQSSCQSRLTSQSLGDREVACPSKKKKFLLLNWKLNLIGGVLAKIWSSSWQNKLTK